MSGNAEDSGGDVRALGVVHAGDGADRGSDQHEPYFLQGGQFTGLSEGLIYNFLTVDGVFGIFAPAADPLIKYEEIYIRSMDDVVNGGQ
ncbi:MAG: hypothetical protein R3B70_15430 [Polyangiaceae bacterium]